MNNFITWLEKERGEYAAIAALAVCTFIVLPAIVFGFFWLVYLTGGWILLALIIAPAWVAWMFYCYITRDRDQ